MVFLSHFTHLEKRLKRHVSGPVHTFRAFAHLGFESVLASELSRCGISHFENFPGGLLINTRLAEAWKICAYSRTLRRLDMEIAHFHAENFGKLEKEFEKISWELFFDINELPQIKVKTKKSRLYHSEAIKERLEIFLSKKYDAQKDQNSNQRIRIEFDNDSCRIYIDIGGVSMYKRGYDKFVENAPIQDSLAASILLAGGIFQATGLIDPMCGSGTFSLESAAMIKNFHPAFSKTFAFEGQPAFKPDSFNYTKEHLPNYSFSENFLIHTFDINKKCIQTVLKNIEFSKTSDLISPQNKDFFDGIIPHKPGSLLVLNPPYGIRLQANTKRLYCEIGKKIRSDYRDCKVALICPDHTTLHAFSPGVISAVRTNHGGLNIFVIFAEARKL
jgi:putative N6-adenine-specific DNA methylase